ncbi:MAG TPA: 2-oxo acid dehydrogenase subunit E2 [Ignavibacteriaceae bacterium]|nr:2-oxo acid dehydrogenase subunit E2 [Ignavibacteriaceae bacterium]
MATEFKLPELGENIEAADVLNILVKVGDKVEKDQGIIEIETDKATIEVPSTVSGIIKEILIKPGEKVKVGQAIVTFDEGNSKVVSKPAEKKETVTVQKEEIKQPAEKKSAPEARPVKSASEVVEMKLPELGENIESADVLNVLVKTGDIIEKDQGVIEIETDKATIEVPSTLSGKVVDILLKPGEKAKVGQVILKVETSDITVEEKIVAKKPELVQAAEEEKVELKNAANIDSSKGERNKFAPGEVDQQPPIAKEAAPAAPSVRRIAREIGVDINKVPGSGPFGRISMDDVKAYAKKLNESRESQTSFGIKQEALPDFSKFGEFEVKPMSNIRAKTGIHLSYAWQTIPHVTQHDKADITELEKIRKSYNPKVEKAGGKLTVTAILLKVISAALKVFPQFNSSVDLEKKQVIYKKYFNIGIAVDTEHGLIVPVIKNVDHKNLTELAVEMNSIAEKARIRKISLDELQGGCFTITNLGGIGGTSFTPIVNSPEVAILGVSRGSFEPVYREATPASPAGGFEPRLMLPLSLSYDHRIIDGADAARFLRWVCEALEQPIKILIEG